MILRLWRWNLAVDFYRVLSEADRLAVEKALEGWARAAGKTSEGGDGTK